ncbi:MAG: response regulator transcription factor [Bacteroidales bacterium]|nr:response regulator transcription factor [Bacteroidales bacterium]
MNVLLVEDEIDFQKVLAEYLTLSGFNVISANHGKQGLDAFNNKHIDLCILDVMMPIMDGFTLAEKLRSKDPELPIIFLTAKNQKEDKLQGLKLGADDYITKPFEAEELVLRIHNILRRSGSIKNKKDLLGSLELNMDELKLVSEKNKYQLTKREAELLTYLIKNKNQVVSRNQVLEELWGKNDYFMGRSMDVFISRIRKYLHDDNTLELETIRGIGFILKELKKK